MPPTGIRAGRPRWVDKDDSGRYTIGPRLHELSAASSGDRLRTVALLTLRRLRDDTGESAQIYRRKGNWRLCVASVELATGLRDTVPEGAVLTMSAGSAAQVLAAWSDGPSAFDAKALNAVRNRGWADSVAERESGVASVSAPVLPADVIAAVSISGPIDRLTKRPGQRFGTRSGLLPRRWNANSTPDRRCASLHAGPMPNGDSKTVQSFGGYALRIKDDLTAVSQDACGSRINWRPEPGQRHDSQIDVQPGRGPKPPLRRRPQSRSRTGAACTPTAADTQSMSGSNRFGADATITRSRSLDMRGRPAAYEPTTATAWTCSSVTAHACTAATMRSTSRRRSAPTIL